MAIKRLEVDEIIKLIKARKTFEATAADGSFSIKINRYLPYCCTAIHDGSNLRSDLRKKMALDEYARWYEEDPFTGAFIASMPITLVGHDSRFEYDLNRSPETAVYKEAWGKNVWTTPLSSKEIQASKLKHSNYYKVTHALVTKLEEIFDGCVVYDIHSYNFERWDRKVPLFNIGTENIDSKKYGEAIEHWKNELAHIVIDGVENTTAINDVFHGRGYNLEFITKNFNKTLVLATEVKKVYCNELTGAAYPKIVKALQENLKHAIVNNANFFSRDNTNWKHNSAAKLLDRKLDPAILTVDRGMSRLIRGFELLGYVNPINNISEQKKFFSKHYTEIPNFKYSPIRINAYELKQELSRLPVQNISDVSIRNMYEAVVNSYFDKIDLLTTLDTPKFLYNSLRYFGRPSKIDIQNAQYILHLPSIPGEPKRIPTLGTEQAIASFKEGLASYGFKSKIATSNKVIAKVMVLNAKKTIVFRPDAKFTRGEINALLEHEIGVHMVTTMNAASQDLRLFKMGLPVNTMTQEGLAVLSEYLSGNMSIKRLKKLAHRVIIVDMMCNGANFKECFQFLHNNYVADPNEAYSIVTRIFRGGGFTKDHLYLSGFVQILRFWEKGHSLDPLLVGKTSLEFYSTIEEMIERDLIKSPQYVTQSFVKPKAENNSEIYEYIFSGLK